MNVSVLRIRIVILILFAAVLVSSVVSCAARKPGAPITPGFNIYSVEQDVQLGSQLSARVRQQVDVVDNRTLQRYITRLGQKLAHTPDAEGFPYTFTLINDPSINAFALPGGPVFINSGAVRAAENEAQLAGVIAHEIAHVKLRHSTSQASKANLLQLPAAIAGVVIGQGSVGAQLGQLGLGLGLEAALLRYSRDAETEADALGARIMSEAGYNPIEMARFFEKLKGENNSQTLTFLSDHPDPGNRTQAVEAEVRTLPRRSYRAKTGQFDRAQQLAGQLPAPRRQPSRG